MKIEGSKKMISYAFYLRESSVHFLQPLGEGSVP